MRLFPDNLYVQRFTKCTLQVLVAYALLLLLGACDFLPQSGSPRGQDQEINEIKQDLEFIKSEVAYLKAIEEERHAAAAAAARSLLVLKSEINSMRAELDQVMHKTAKQAPDSVRLNFDSQGYWPIETSAGTLFVSCRGAEPYLDGFKVTIDVGNPFFLTIEGEIETSLVRGATSGPGSDPQSQGGEEKNGSNPKQKDIIQRSRQAFPEGLKPGVWNRIVLIVKPANAHDLNSLFISIETTQVALKAPTKATE